MNLQDSMVVIQPPKKITDEWPDFLNPKIIDVIDKKLNFTKMTPVQVS